MFHRLQILTILLISYIIVTSTRSNKRTFNTCSHRHHQAHSAIAYTASEINPSVQNYFYPQEDQENNNEEEEDYSESMGSQQNNMDDIDLHSKSPSHEDSESVQERRNEGNNKQSDKDNEISEYFLKAYFPELNDFYPGAAIAGPQEYHITIQPNIKEIRNKLAKKISQTSTDFKNAMHTIRTMLSEETIEAISNLITLPTTEFQFIKNVIKILKITMENVIICVSTAGNRLMALPKRWSLSYQPCVMDEFKESWGIIERVHHIFQNAVYYLKNFIIKLETCFNHEDSLVQWCINNIFNNVPLYVQDTVTKLNRELDNGISYLKAVPARVERCEMDDSAEKKLLLPFMITREMVKCVLTKAEL